jgi:hypothetical protein
MFYKKVKGDFRLFQKEPYHVFQNIRVSGVVRLKLYTGFFKKIKGGLKPP